MMGSCAAATILMRASGRPWSSNNVSSTNGSSGEGGAMADNIGQAFEALGARWEAIFAREQERFAVVQTRDHFQEALSDMHADRVMRDNLTHHGTNLSVSSEGTALWTPADFRQMSGRSLGYDGPDDVRLPQEYGAAPGSLAAVKADLALEDTLVREAQEYALENPTLLDTIESLQQRLEQLPTPEQSRTQDQQREQGMER